MDDWVISIVGFLTLYPSDLFLRKEKSGVNYCYYVMTFLNNKLIHRFLSL